MTRLAAQCEDFGDGDDWSDDTQRTAFYGRVLLKMVEFGSILIDHVRANAQDLARTRYVTVMLFVGVVCVTLNADTICTYACTG